MDQTKWLKNLVLPGAALAAVGAVLFVVFLLRLRSKEEQGSSVEQGAEQGHVAHQTHGQPEIPPYGTPDRRAGLEPYPKKDVAPQETDTQSSDDDQTDTPDDADEVSWREESHKLDTQLGEALSALARDSSLEPKEYRRRRIELFKKYFAFPYPVLREWIRGHKDLWTDPEFVALIAEDMRKYKQFEPFIECLTTQSAVTTARYYQVLALDTALRAGAISPEEAFALFLPYVDASESRPIFRKEAGLSLQGLNPKESPISSELAARYLQVFRKELEQPLDKVMREIYENLIIITTEHLAAEGYQGPLPCPYDYGGALRYPPQETLVMAALYSMYEWAICVPATKTLLETELTHATGEWRYAVNHALLFAGSPYGSLPLAADAALNAGLVSIRDQAAQALGLLANSTYLGVLQQAAASDPYYYNDGCPGDYYMPYNGPRQPTVVHYPVRLSAQYAIDAINERGGKPGSAIPEKEED